MQMSEVEYDWDAQTEHPGNGKRRYYREKSQIREKNVRERETDRGNPKGRGEMKQRSQLVVIYGTDAIGVLCLK